MNSSKHIAICGAGLVGSLLSIYLAKRGYKVSVFERRGDMRHGSYVGGRSINLALSNRGIRALAEVGLAEEIKKVAIPMHGRVMHNRAGELSFLQYGKEGQFINSVSRSALNIVLMDKAEELGVDFHFEQRITKVDLEKTILTVDHGESTVVRNFDLIIGADGAFSAVRGALQFTDRFDYSQDYIDHGYKELHIPPGTAGSFQLEKNALHIWPRESFMMIALPNPDGSFTCTLFFPFEGSPSFNRLKTDAEVSMFFESTFPDAVKLMPSLLEDYNANPTSSLVTVRCYPWVKNNTLLIGDAAHAIVPFFGQGMNAGFEDCRILNNLLNQYDDQWGKVLDEQLIEWANHPEDFIEEGLVPPSHDTIQLAFKQVLKPFQAQGHMPPSHVVPDANGGIVFELRSNDAFESIRVQADGHIEYCCFRSGRLVDRQNWR